MEAYRWHEQESLRNLYETELSILARGLGGIFELIKPPEKNNGRVVVLGKLKYDDNKEQSLQVIFPTKYPSSCPKVIAVDIQNGGNGNVVGLSQHHFEKGNQYNDGSLCLLYKEDWNSKEHNIGWVLRRAQGWLNSATSEEGFKPDEIVEEIPAPLPHKGQVLMPKNYELPENSKTGQFLLNQFKPNYYILEHNILPSSPFSLNLGVKAFDWYSFDEGVQLNDIFSPKNPLKMMEYLTNIFGKNPLDGKSKNNFALHFPSEPNSWHFFKISSNSVGSAQINYFITRNINKELYHRTKDIFDEDILKKKRVTIIGLGALGSEVSRSLARNAVGHFNLFDNDTFEIGNSVRHAADLFYIGESKVDVVKQLILRSNPNITVNTFKGDVLNDNGRLEKSVSQSDLCIVLTAEDYVDYMINDIYVPAFDIPFIFARVSTGGFSGSIQVVQYEKTPCLRCLSAQEADILPEPKDGVKFDELSPEYGDCSSPALPGSEIDTKEVALQVSRIALQELLSSEDSVYPDSKGKQYYWHGPMGSAEKAPFTWNMKNLKKRPDCSICKSQK